MDKKEIVIIGAGPAGLTAGYELTKLDNCIVKVFEQDSQVGGISKTIKYKGNRMDIGGHRFFSKNDWVMQWWANIFHLQNRPSIDEILNNDIHSTEAAINQPISDPQTMDRVMLIRKRISRIFYLKKFFSYPISLSIETFRNMGLWRTIKAGCGYVRSVLCKKKETSLENFYINRFGKPLYKMFFENYTEKVWGVHPSKLGADWGSQRVKGLSIIAILKDVITKPFKHNGSIDQKNVETSLIETFIYPKYGPGQLWEAVADDISSRQNGVVSLNSNVKKINIANNRVISVVVEKDGQYQTIECDALLSTMPIKDLIEAIEGIEIPTEVKQIAQTLPYRDFITVGLLLDKLLITNKTKIKTVANIVPDTWIYIQESNVKLGRLQIFNNWSPYMVTDLENNVWIGLEYFCNEGDELWNMSDENFIKFAVDELASIGIINKENVKDAVRVKIKKAYPAYYGSYYKLPKVIEFLNTIENLYCIGRNGQHRYNNMDHSMLTALEAVNNITGKTSDKRAIWDVNTEKDYHETKKS
ncbi:MAG: NAD(P)/FAD-dependent oxidoreductase [Bacteroidales bacterium]|jgi:protoporphyrinogen oxidase|nr:NAD(P)/FAD-dependent oxidoreductase [Bacteroidales bacterium]